jgi:hypothetical protein
MRLVKTIELGGGIATGLLGMALSLYVMKPAETPSDYLGLFSVTTCAALFVAVGAYAHTVSHNSWGRILLLAGGIVLIYTTASLLLKVPLGLYLRGWVGLFLVLPGTMALVTVMASLFFRAAAEK